MHSTAFIFQQHNHSRKFIAFINEHFSDRQYKPFLLTSVSNTAIPYEGAIVLRYSSMVEEVDRIVEICKNHDIIYLVSPFFSPIVKLYISLFYKELIHRLVWIEWGYDLYKNDNPRLSVRIKSAFKNLAKKLFEARIPVFVAIHPADLPVYDEIVRGRAVKYSIPYAFSGKYELYENDNTSIEKKIQSGESIVIQVGNRADRPLNHLAILNKLSVYKDFPIKVLLPLSYGNKDYALTVKNKAEELFGDKAMCLMDFMEYSEYSKILNTVDILIIDSERQIALGNIHPMLYRKKKIFLSPTSPLYKYYKENNVLVYSIETLGRISFEMLCHEDDLSNGREYLINYKKKTPLQNWTELFDSIDKVFDKGSTES